MSADMFFDGWASLGRTLVIGILAYAALVFFLRISGVRTLSKMNSFDLIVTVALGSTLATVLLSKEVSLASGVLALALLIFLQFIITWTSVRSRLAENIVKSEPVLVLHRGKLLEDAMKRARVTRSEIFAGLRQQGIAAVEEAEAVVIENDGSFTVLPKKAGDSQSSLSTVPAPK